MRTTVGIAAPTKGIGRAHKMVRWKAKNGETQLEQPGIGVPTPFEPFVGMTEPWPICWKTLSECKAQCTYRWPKTTTVGITIFVFRPTSNIRIAKKTRNRQIVQLYDDAGWQL